VTQLIQSLSPVYAAAFKTSMDAIAPGWQGVLQKTQQTVQSFTSGRLPPDVAAMIERTMAEKNLQGGRVGQVADASSARTLGLTSLDLAKYGVEAGTKLLATEASMVPDVSSLVQSSLQYTAQREQSATQQRQFAQDLALRNRSLQETSALERLRLSLVNQQQTNQLAVNQQELRLRGSELDLSRQRVQNEFISNQQTLFARQQEVFANLALGRERLDVERSGQFNSAQANLWQYQLGRERLDVERSGQFNSAQANLWQYQLGTEQNALRRTELSNAMTRFDQEASWTKQVSQWNRSYEKWVNMENSRLMEEELTRKAATATQNNTNFSSNLTSLLARLDRAVGRSSNPYPAI
jgi:hypothetical protein